MQNRKNFYLADRTGKIFVLCHFWSRLNLENDTCIFLKILFGRQFWASSHPFFFGETINHVRLFVYSCNHPLCVSSFTFNDYLTEITFWNQITNKFSTEIFFITNFFHPHFLFFTSSTHFRTQHLGFEIGT